MLKPVALAALTVLAVIAGRADAAVAPDCPIEHSSYRLRLDPTITARFMKITKVPGLISDLAFAVTWHQHDTTYWYIFDSGTDPYINMVSSADPTAANYMPPVEDWVKRPHADTQYLAVRADLSFDDRVPQSGRPAPKLILMPRLAEIERYLGPSDHSFFELSGCAKTAAPELNRPSKAR